MTQSVSADKEYARTGPYFKMQVVKLVPLVACFQEYSCSTRNNDICGL